MQENYDIFPDLAEEAYLASHPEARPARAFLTMCGNGNAEGILELLQVADGEHEEEEEEKDDDMGDDDDRDDADGETVPNLSAAQLLRYQDPLNNMESGLHVAVDRDQELAACLLLYLASTLPAEAFPPHVVPFAALVKRPDPTAAPAAGLADIRTLLTTRGETAEAYAARRGGVWTDMLQRGMFSL